MTLQIIDQRTVLEKDFRIYGTFEEPLFLARDVAEWIDFSKTGKGQYDVSRMLGTIDDEEKLVRTIFVSGQNRNMWFLTEEGLYEVLMQSRKPIAKTFKSEVKKILKQIRLTGGFSLPQTYPEALRCLADETEKNQKLTEQIEEQKPLVHFAKAVESAETSILVGDLAKLLKQNGVDIGQNRLFEKLRKEGYLCGSGERYNMPTQHAMNLELFEVKERVFKNPDGSLRITRTTKVTGKGQVYFINRYRKKVALCLA